MEINRILKKVENLNCLYLFLFCIIQILKIYLDLPTFIWKKILKDHGFSSDITLIGVGPFFAAYQNIFRYLKLPFLKTLFFILFEIFNRITKIFSKDFSKYYCGIHASCNKK